MLVFREIRKRLRLWLQDEAPPFHGDLQRGAIGVEPQRDLALNARKSRVPDHRERDGVRPGELDVDRGSVTRSEELADAAQMVPIASDRLETHEARAQASSPFASDDASGRTSTAPIQSAHVASKR